jgi:N6-adenosine-specific RNA methylase IME4
MVTQTGSLLQEVSERHALALSSFLLTTGEDEDLEGGRSASSPHAREHARWKELVNDVDDDHDDDNAIAAKGDEHNSGRKEDNMKPVLEDALSLPSSSLGPAYIPAESTVRNDNSQHFVDTGAGRLPGNAVCNPYKASRFIEYPKLKRLIEIKSGLLSSISHPPVYLQTDLLHSLQAPPTSATTSATSSFHLAKLLPIKYDVVIIDPPLESYDWESVPELGSENKSRNQLWSWDQIASLPIPQIMAKESFIFLWIGSGANDGLERGREVLTRWGYRRCEDIVWVQTNSSSDEDGGGGGASDNDGQFVPAASSSCFAKSAQHCLMGIRGTVRRASDTRFVHCNIDTDVILWPGEESRKGSKIIDTRSKPPEMMDLVENFCLGTRRLELFGRNRNLRRGWLTVGMDLGPQAKGWEGAERGENACAAHARQSTPIAYEKSTYDGFFGVDRAGCALAERINLVPFHEEVEALRPRSPSSGADRRTLQPSSSPSISQIQHHQQQHSFPGPEPTASSHSALMQFNPNLGALSIHSSGGGISGLGAGGSSVVSIPSGSEMLSGAQASVLLGQVGSTNHARPSQANGLSRQRKNVS